MIYNRNKGSRGNANIVEIELEQKYAFILNYLEYKSSRRVTNYNSFTCKEPGKDDIFLDFKTGSNKINIAIEF